MHRDGDACLFLIVVKPVVNLLDFIVFARECLAGDGYHADLSNRSLRFITSET